MYYLKRKYKVYDDTELPHSMDTVLLIKKCSFLGFIYEKVIYEVNIYAYYADNYKVAHKILNRLEGKEDE